MNSIEILDCTLRDGAYAIDFQFTPKDVGIIAGALENLGLQYIELGHGLGLNASESGKGVAAGTDEEYLQAAASTLQRASWGMFFIPGIGREEDLRLAAQYKMHFVRIGTNVTEVKQAEPYVHLARELGMHVSVNLMKSHVLPPKELAIEAKRCEDFGAHLVYLVDSPGGMLPEEVAAYAKAMQEATSLPLGFHAHNNLGMAMANVLTAIQHGIMRVDSTLQGIGRGGGNAPTEVLIAVLKKKKLDPGIDLHNLMSISKRLIQPLLQEKGWNALNVISGAAGFHSSHLQTIFKYANRYEVDPGKLIEKVCEVDQVEAPEELVEEMARLLAKELNTNSPLHVIALPNFVFPVDKAKEKDALAESMIAVAEELQNLAKKKGTSSVLNVFAPIRPRESTVVSRFIQEGFGFVIGSVELTDTGQLKEIIRVTDGVVENFLVDAEKKSYLKDSLFLISRGWIKRSKVFGYRDTDVWLRSVERQIVERLERSSAPQITILGTDALQLRLSLALLERGYSLCLTGGALESLEAAVASLKRMVLCPDSVRLEPDLLQAAKNARALVAFGGKNSIDFSLIEVLDANAIVIYASAQAISPEAIQLANLRGISILRPDMRAALASEISLAVGQRRITTQIAGRREILGVTSIAGGVLGQFGDVIVDSIQEPTKVLGIADGKGNVIYNPSREFEEKIRQVENELSQRQIFADS